VAFRSKQSAWGTRPRVKRMGIRAVDADRMIVTALQDLLRSPEKLRSMLTDLGRSTDELSKACKTAAIAGRRLEATSRDQLRSILRCIITRVEVSRERVQLVTRPLEIEQLLNWNFVGLFRRKTEDTSRLSAHVMNIPCAGDVRLERSLRLPLSTCKGRAKQRSNGLRKLLSDARNAWLVVEENRGASPADLARTCKLSISRFMRLLRVNYLAPDILTAIMDGTQPPNLTRRELLDANLPLDWTLQRQMFGFPDQPPMRTNEQG
jgi:site-specific DNA recombinase